MYGVSGFAHTYLHQHRQIDCMALGKRALQVGNCRNWSHASSGFRELQSRSSIEHRQVAALISMVHTYQGSWIKCRHLLWDGLIGVYWSLGDSSLVAKSWN
jgi:hypothetical protein